MRKGPEVLQVNGGQLFVTAHSTLSLRGIIGPLTGATSLYSNSRAHQDVGG